MKRFRENESTKHFAQGEVWEVTNIIPAYGDREPIENKQTLVIIEASRKDLERGLSVHKPGAYGFRGMWYGDNFTDTKSFGKIEFLPNPPDNRWKKLGTVEDFDKNTLKGLLT